MITPVGLRWQSRIKTLATLTSRDTHTRARTHRSSLILNNTHMGHFHNTQRTSRRREIERASGKRENEGEEVSTLLGGLARSSLWDTFTHRTHTGVRTHTHTRAPTKERMFRERRSRNAAADGESAARPRGVVLDL